MTGPQAHRRPPVTDRSSAVPTQVVVRPARRSGGFTLLEIVIATLLLAVLMGAVWSLLGTYGNLFEDGQARAEQTQLVRSLMEQIADDLQSAIQDDAAVDPAARESGTAVRRFGFFGTERALRLDVLQPVPQPQGNVQSGAEMLADGGMSAGNVPELHTVYYQFREPGTLTGGADPLARTGLTRREVDYQTPYDATAVPPPSGQGGGIAGAATAGAGTAGAVDDSILWVPEVAGLGFRYFDGQGWTSQWDSIQRKSLPVAVEVTLRVGASAEEAPEPAATAIDEAPEELEDLAEDAAPTVAAEPDLPTYRTVIFLASANLQEHVERRPQRPSRPIVRRVSPRPRPQPQPIRPRTQPERTVMPDQWMRTGR